MKKLSLVAVLAVAVMASGCLSAEAPKEPKGYNTENSCKVVGEDVAVTMADSAISFNILKVDSKIHLVYSDAASGKGDLYHEILNLDGSVAVAAKRVNASPDASVAPEMLDTPDGLLLVWEETGTAARDVMAVYLNKSAGGPSGAVAKLLSSTSMESRPTLSVAPDNRVALATMQITGGKQAVYVNYIGNIGGSPALNSAMPTVRVGSTTADVTHPVMVKSGSNLVVAFADARSGLKQIYTTLIDASGVVQGDNLVRTVTTGEGILPRMINAGSKLFVTWEDMRTETNEIYAIRLNANGAVDSQEWLVHKPKTGDANWSNIAWSGSRLATTYYQFRYGPAQIFLTITDENGSSSFPTEEEGTPDAEISLGPNSSKARFPSIAWLDGTNYALAWLDNRDMAGKMQVYFANVSCEEK